MILVGSCNDWGKDINSTRDLYTFTPVEGSSWPGQEYCLQLRILTRHHLSFQIIHADSLWDWRLHPVSGEKHAKELRRSVQANAQITLRSQEISVHGLNFRIREDPPASVVLTVRLEDDAHATLWYERQGSGGREALAPPWQTCEEVGRLRLAGSFCRRRKQADGLVLEPQEEKALQRQELCLRLRHEELKFQIISDRLGAEWRLCPQGHKHSGVLACGQPLTVSPSRRGDGQGRGHFRIRESYLAVVLLTVHMEVLEDGAVGSVQVSYTVEERTPSVAIGPREVQFPPQEPSQTELMIAKIVQNPRILEVVKERLRAVATVVRRELNTKVLPPPPPPEEAPQPQRVAGMLMLLPCSLAGWPGVFQTFLHYHLLAPEGPRLAHMFVFIDELVHADDGEDAWQHGDQATVRAADEDEEEDPSAGLGRWLEEAEEAAALRPLVTLLDGSGPACLQAELGLRKPELDAKLRAAALGGELVARQILNMQRCLPLAHEHGLDWLLCNLDADEALLCPERTLGALLAAVPHEIWQVHLVNHEAVLEESVVLDEVNQERMTNFFLGCTLFKRNPLLLMESRGRSDEQRRCMDFWGSRVAAAAAETQNLIGDVGNPPLRPSDGYFSAYFIGKSAIRVPQCYGRQLVPTGPHDWPVLEQGTARLDPDWACLLHYVNCQGAAGLLRKYRARKQEQWNRIEFHGLCQRAFASDSFVLTELVQKCLVLRRGDAEELERQLEAGVCMRITSVRDAICGCDH